jgi:hypothetical protein
MRLLNVDDLTFQEFHDPDIPKYAIASHRWIAGTEATLESIQERKNTHTLGYQKVLGFAEYVKKHIPGLHWLWIDTCCIDQKSSQELSESINSMFRWYRDAEVCLAYLQDVPTSHEMATLADSNWFTRGWTLQELLAPTVVVFLASDWEIVGHKGQGGRGRSGASLETGKRLDHQIAAITGIPEYILHDYSGNSLGLTVDEKLRWMAERQTSREEDDSYCLLGIVGVTMTIRYGDGREATRARLLKKLRSGKQCSCYLDRLMLTITQRESSLPYRLPCSTTTMVICHI